MTIPLEVAADRLLATATRDPVHPCFSEPAFRRKLALARRRTPPPTLPLTTPVAYLVGREWAEIADRARLTERQRTVVALRAESWTFLAIGEALGCTKQGAARIFLQARKKILAARHVYPLTGLADVYREETRRKGSGRRLK